MITGKRLPSRGQLMFGFMCAFCLVLILRNSDAAIEYMSAGLMLCAETVIPSLFPFMVISGLIITSGLGELVGKLLDRPLGLLFGISGVSSCAVLMGALCGFPIGAKTAVTLYDGNYISKAEASRLLTFCNNPSSAFIISAVGASLYSNKSTGVLLYIVTLINSFIIGIFQRFFFGGTSSGNPACPHRKAPDISSFTDAVSDAAQSMLVICAYVTFFSAVIGCFGHMLISIGCSPALMALLYGLVELSGGVSSSAALGVDCLSVCLTAFIIGWSGLSVHFQILSLCSGRGLRFGSYFIAKLAQGILNVISVFFIYTVSPERFLPVTDSTSVSAPTLLPLCLQIPILIIFISALFLLLCKKLTDIHKSTRHVIY